MALTRSRPPEYSAHLLDRNYSTRWGTPRAIAIHTTESHDRPGVSDLQSLHDWFNYWRSRASSHIGVDGEGHVWQFVASDKKAWTIGQLNSWTLNIELIGFASQSKAQFEDAQLKAAARWCAYWGHKYSIPMQRGSVEKVTWRPVIVRKGIIKHSDLSRIGYGSHYDPGPNFPMDKFLDYCKHYYREGWPANV